MKVAVLGATSKTGRYLIPRLAEGGHEVTVIGRSRERLDRLDARARRARADLERPGEVSKALVGAECVVSLAHARFTEAVLAALPHTCCKVVLTGSLRKHTRLPDPAADAVRAGEVAFLDAGREGVMIHPSMIFGAPEDRNVNRVLRYLQRWPAWLPAIVPLPDGGRHLLQPVFVDDMVAALAAAVERSEASGPPIEVAGPEPISYAEMVRACARALGRRALILPIPASFLVAVARVVAAFGVRLPASAAELGRAAEDKRVDVSAMRERLGVTPRPFAEALRLKLERGWV